MQAGFGGRTDDLASRSQHTLRKFHCKVVTKISCDENNVKSARIIPRAARLSGVVRLRPFCGSSARWLHWDNLAVDRLFPMPPVSQSPDAGAAVVDAILSGATEQLDALLPQALNAAPTERGAALVQLFWNAWRQHSGLHGQLLEALDLVCQALAAQPAAAWVAASGHPLWALLDVVQQGGAGYQPELGRAAEKWRAELQAALTPLTAGDWPGALTQLQQQWQNEQQRLAKLEQRLVDAERGQLRTRRAQQQAARVLNGAMAGKRLAPAAVEYLQQEWYRELQWGALQFGDNGEPWQRRAALTERLVLSLQEPADDDEARQHLYRLIPEVDAELRAVLGEHAIDPETLERQLSVVQQQHLVLLKGQAPAPTTFTLLANHDPWLFAATSISRDLLRQVTELDLQRWFLLRHNDGETRIKLVLKMDDTGQLLFANRLGVRALQKSFEEFAYLISLGEATPLPVAGHARGLLRPLLLQLTQRAAERARLHDEASRRAASEQQRRQQAKEKALAEAAALAQQQAAAEAATLAQAREQEALRRRAHIEEQGGDVGLQSRTMRQQATLLAVGSWVELHDELGNTQRVKLAVKLSSGKLIFVDREGARRAEFDRDTFAQRLLDGGARLLDQGPQFDDTLARVVHGLRRDRVTRE